jgi:hypothetical protein
MNTIPRIWQSLPVLRVGFLFAREELLKICPQE